MVTVATAGAACGIGIARGQPLEPFLDVGRRALTSPSGLVPLDWLAVFGGLAVHALWMTIWGAVFFIVARQLRGRWLLLAAIVASALLLWVSSGAAPSTLGALRGLAASRWQTISFGVVLGIARFAGVALQRVVLSPAADGTTEHGVQA